MGCLPDRRHDEEEERNQAHGIDPVRQGGDIVPAGPTRQPPGLPGIKKVTDNDRERGARKNHPGHHGERDPAHQRTKRRDQQQLKKIVDKKPDKPIPIPLHKPFRFHIS
jgi:hypothetical protein